MKDFEGKGAKPSLNCRSFLGITGVVAGASSVVFTTDELKELNAALSDIHVQGQCLPDSFLALSGVEAAPKR